jgi:hypothetical protein
MREVLGRKILMRILSLHLMVTTFRAQFHAKHVRRPCWANILVLGKIGEHMRQAFWANIFTEHFPQHVGEALHKQGRFFKHVGGKCLCLIKVSNMYGEYFGPTFSHNMFKEPSLLM